MGFEVIMRRDQDTASATDNELITYRYQPPRLRHVVGKVVQIGAAECDSGHARRKRRPHDGIRRPDED